MLLIIILIILTKIQGPRKGAGGGEPKKKTTQKYINYNKVMQDSIMITVITPIKSKHITLSF